MLARLLFAPLLGLLPRRSEAWAETERLFAELESLPCKPVMVATEFELVCHVAHEAVDIRFLESAIGCVNAEPFLYKAPARFRFDGLSWTRTVTADGRPGPDRLTYRFSLHQDHWGSAYPAADFGRFPMTGITGEFTATPYCYGAFCPRLV
jgi:hypothetical protein